MSFDTKAGSPTSSSSTSTVRDERIGAENSQVLKGSGNIIMSGGDAVSEKAVAEIADLAHGVTDTAESLGLEGFDLARDTGKLVADVVAAQADASQAARELDLDQLNTYAAAARNLADSSIQNSAGLAETKLTGGLNKLMEELTLGLVVGAVLMIIMRKRK